MRVNRPSVINTPVTASIVPAATTIAGKGPDIPGIAIGKCRNLIVACSRKSRAATIRKRLRIRGVHSLVFMGFAP